MTIEKAGRVPTAPGHGKDLMTTTTADTAARLADLADHVAKHYLPDVYIHPGEGEPLAVDHLLHAFRRLHEFADEVTDAIETNTHVPFLNTDGEEVYVRLEIANPAELEGALMLAAAEAAALHRELAAVTSRGIALIRLINTTERKS